MFLRYLKIAVFLYVIYDYIENSGKYLNNTETILLEVMFDIEIKDIEVLRN